MLSEKSVEYITRKVAGTHAILLGFAGTVEGDAKRNANWTDRSSHARQSIHSGVEGNGRNLTVYLAHGVKYGRYLEEGTAPHIIRPKNKKALYWSGAKHPVAQVNHPGTRPYPALENAINRNKGTLEKNINDWWSNKR